MPQRQSQTRTLFRSLWSSFISISPQ